MQRQLAAILCTDIAGYARLMASDETGTLTRLKTDRATIDPLIAGLGGRVVKTTGDGLLVEFSSVVAAVEAAIEIQAAMTRRGAEEPEAIRRPMRIGIHLGDVIHDDGDIYGDGVNIAARLQEVSVPGGIAMSRLVAESVAGKLDVALVDEGPRNLKNIATPVHVYRIDPKAPAAAGRPLPLPDKPSIAVLPFANMSNDLQQEYFADGITEDIITALSRHRSLFVIARNSTFTYKGRAVDIKRVGQELGVRYVLEGSVRRSGDRLRITGQLVDASSGRHLWADRFDGALDDVFDLQDRMTGRVVSALLVNVEQAEMDRAGRKPTSSLDAYDYCLRAKALFARIGKPTAMQALDLLDRAIECDPEYGAAYALAAWYHAWLAAHGLTDDRSINAGRAARMAQRAAALAPDDPAVLGLTGYTMAYMVRDLEAATGFVSRALALSPNFAPNWVYSAWVRIWQGEPKTGLDHAREAIRLNPLDPAIILMRNACAHALFFLDRFDDAAAAAREGLQERSESAPALRIGTAALAMAGRPDEATELRRRLQAVDPGITVANLAARLGPYRRAADVARYAEGLRRAGLPE
ncbi:MAG: adenylate/guanylate cyclase domain-containing protein [Alphaproteobacteria bacterium]|nr:adenylate/guanylate cyclase domain-containing protein [Alphaproteobacteria bacterium]